MTPRLYLLGILLWTLVGFAFGWYDRLWWPISNTTIMVLYIIYTMKTGK